MSRRSRHILSKMPEMWNERFQSFQKGPNN
jgi:hypothetical protein